MKPKLEALRIAEVKLQDAQKELEAAESKLQDCQDVLTKLQSKFEAQMAKKRAIEDNAARTRSRMEQVRLFFVSYTYMKLFAVRFLPFSIRGGVAALCW